MSEIYLSNGQRRAAAIEAVKNAKLGSTITVMRKRSNAQNSRYWGRGVLAQIAEQARVGGQKFSAESWHELFKQMFIGVIELPNGNVVGKSSADLDVETFAKFVLEVEAYAVTELGVVFSDERSEVGA